jgi:uncharacterized protein (TIGR02246 family)
MEAATNERRDFIPYPTDRVVGTLSDAKAAHTAIDALLRRGFAREDVEILHGEEDLTRLDPDGTEHGFLAQFQRSVMRNMRQNEEYAHLLRHVEDVRAGRFVIMVLARDRERRTIAADVLSDHGAEFIGFYGRWAWRGFSGTNHEGPGLPTRPEQIPALFADAWNARDPDALAALFEEGAEFVNVIGLWWHDRASIRKAHAYGLEHIFNASTLAVDETRVKHVRDDVAVVHARMTLSGQTPVGRVRQPWPRTNIFSFVVHRAGERWICASAHNTDVVPNMETNIMDEEGRFRSANYRSGEVS